MRSVLYTGALWMTMTACTGLVEAPDEGAGSSTGVAVCSSNSYWKDKETGSELMHPGGACTTCHKKPENVKSPIFAIAGTVYPTSHEPDDCNGVASTIVEDGGMSEVSVVVTDKTGQTKPPIPVNSVGNFHLVDILAPFNVKVVYKGKENKMMMQAPHGDCNACHTQTGAEGAPGRVIIPQ